MLVIAHRGYSAKFPENTPIAIHEAIKLSAPAIEIDVHLSKDKELVVTHDHLLGRCVKGAPEGSSLSDFSAKELAAFDAGSFKGPNFAQERIPTLTQVLDAIANKCVLNIEIKEETLKTNEAYETMAVKVLESLHTYGLKNIVFSSFDHHMLKILRAKSKEARIAVLDDRADKGPQIETAKNINAEFYNINLKRSSFEVVKFIQSHGLKVLSYTAKTQSDLELAKALQINGIFADNLEEALSFFS